MDNPQTDKSRKDNKLEIKKEIRGSGQLVTLSGRLDANWAGHLDDFLNGLVREGSHHISLNMAGVQYLSSAGIRILVNQYKKIKKIGGQFLLEDLSSPVSEVLKMVGMLQILTEPESVPEVAMETESPVTEVQGYRFVSELLSGSSMTIHLKGNPGLLHTSGYQPADSQRIKFAPHQYGLGIGAIGEDFDDCKNRYGEFLALGEALLYKPSDGSKVPDYTVRSGKMEPVINGLYAVLAEGSFSERITFDPVEPGRTITLHDLTAGFVEASGHQNFVYLMIAESGGLVGVSLNTPPVGGNPVFEYPAIRENVQFTTEPAYSRMLTVTFGIHALDPEEPLRDFLRPAMPGSSVFIHAHTAVFPFQALPKRESSAAKLILHLFETSIAEDLLHLITDSREISGLGESTFKQGVAWIGKF